MQLSKGNLSQPHVAPRLPERDLMAALLDRAIWDACGAYETEPHEMRQARYWIAHGQFGAVSFDECCHYLGIDPERIRRRMARVAKSDRERREMLSRRVRAGYRSND